MEGKEVREGRAELGGRERWREEQGGGDWNGKNERDSLSHPECVDGCLLVALSSHGSGSSCNQL